MHTPPTSDFFHQRQHRPAMLRQRIFHRRRDDSGGLPLHDTVVHQLAQLLGEDLLRNAGEGPPKRGEMPGRFRQPIHQDQFPFPADRRQRRRERTTTHRIGTPEPLATVTLKCLLDGNHTREDIPSWENYIVKIQTPLMR